VLPLRYNKVEPAVDCQGVKENSGVPAIYFDVCCLNRPFDDQTWARIHLEAEAVLVILSRCEAGTWEWIGSEVIDWEIAQTPDPERRRRVELLAQHAHRSVIVGEEEVGLAQRFEAWGISALDALHLACAESGGADIFLTTDDKLLRGAAAHAERLQVQVKNPLALLEEVG
jgi:predicted nucleic acid-binding protein